MNFRQILKRISLTVLLAIIITGTILTYIVTLVRYAETENFRLDQYRISIAAMSEVELVHSVHRFNGLESYIVATITHENGEDIYFFIRDGGVQHFFFTADLINLETANTIARQQLPAGQIHRTQLGIINQTPIFEVQINYDDNVHYVVINAETQEIIMQFYT